MFFQYNFLSKNKVLIETNVYTNKGGKQLKKDKISTFAKMIFCAGIWDDSLHCFIRPIKIKWIECLPASPKKSIHSTWHFVMKLKNCYSLINGSY